MNLDQQRTQYRKASQAVSRHVRVSAFLEWIKKTACFFGLFAIAVILTLRWSFHWQSGEWIVTLVLFVGWLSVGAVMAFSRRILTRDALIYLDHVGGWKDRFSSAWQFLEADEQAEETLLHLDSSERHLLEARQAFPEQSGLPDIRFVAIPLVLAFAIASLGLGRRALELEDRKLTDTMKAEAAAQGERLSKEVNSFDAVEALSKEELVELDELRVEVNEIAQDLADTEGLTTGEMLEVLEMRARKAEQFAEELDDDENGWASEAMLIAMESHPDTADLALTIRDEAAAFAAEEAMSLSKQLAAAESKPEIEDRYNLTLQKVANAATEEDKTKPVGERFGNASLKMIAMQTRTAAREFEELAKHFRLLEKREEAREQLENMAESLREAGGDIANSEMQKQEELARSMAQSGPSREGLESIESGEISDDLDSLLNPQLAQTDAPNRSTESSGQGEQPSNTMMPAPVPGEDDGDKSEAEAGSAGKTPKMTLSAPIPGESMPGEKEGGEAPGNGDESRQGSGDGGTLSAPIPGAEPSESALGSGQAIAGNAPSTGRQGGNEAGNASAELIDSESEQLGSTRDERVVTEVGEEGSSTVRAVEGEVRTESAERSSQDLVTDFLAVEEQALDGKSLPRSRREQVIRYFSGIRSQFEISE